MPGPKWSDEEKKILRLYYPMNGSQRTVEALAAAGFMREYYSVQKKARELGISYDTGYNDNYEPTLEEIELAKEKIKRAKGACV